VAHSAGTSAEVDLKPLQEILEQQYNPDNYQDSLELIVQACQEAQHLYRHVPKEAADLIADHLGVSVNRIYGLLTFYADFLTDPPGKHVMVLCHGAACFVMGSQNIVDHLDERHGITSGKTTRDGSLTVQIFNGCLGVCDQAPVALLDHERYCSYLSPVRMDELLDELRQEETPEEPDGTE
jgi:NADH-quinone oxidoreductase subunit E